MAFKNVLFITWDSGSSNYLENLFFPIFDGIQQTGEYRIHILQFSWASPAEVGRIRSIASNLGLPYYHQKVNRNSMLGLAFSLWQGTQKIKSIIRREDIHVVLPRSTNPAIMVNRVSGFLRRHKIRVMFDADGLPLQERIDFLGRNPNSTVFRWLAHHESTCLLNADLVFTRSEKSVDFHVKNLPQLSREKFKVVTNGRNPYFFYPQNENRPSIRRKLGLREQDLLWIYAGALGPAHELEGMVNLFTAHRNQYSSSKFLILSRDVDYLISNFPTGLPDGIIFREVTYEDIPKFLSAADLGISLRRPATSLIGLAPIKIGEYLIMGLPLVTSQGVGDTDELLADKPFVFIYRKGISDPSELSQWIQEARHIARERIRLLGIQHFGLANSISEYLHAFRSLTMRNVEKVGS